MASVAEIAARLTLNGSQFSSQLAKEFGAVEAAARDTATRTRSAFESSFSEVEKLAKRALTSAQGGGGFDVGAKQARDAAVAAEIQAQALREVANAYAATAQRVGDTTEATRLQTQAARAAATEAELAAKSALQYANALDLVQTELNQSASAAEVATRANKLLNQSQDVVTRGAGASAQRSVQASQQIQDFFIQVQGGQSIIVAASQQLSQMAFVMQGAGGTAGKLAAAMSGPYGAAVLLAGMLGGSLIPKLFETEKKTEDLTEKMARQAKEAAAMQWANAAWGQSIDGIVEKTRKLNEELSRQIQTERQLRGEQLATTQGQVSRLESERDATFAQVQQAKSALSAAQAEVRRLSGSPQMGNDVRLGDAFARVSAAQQEVERLARRYNELQVAVGQAADSVGKLNLLTARDKAADLTDPVSAKYRGLREEAERTIKDVDKLARRLADLNKQEEAEQKKEGRQRKPNFGRDISDLQRGDFADAASRYRGLSETGDRSALMGLFKQANINVDPKMTAWCAAFVNAVLATEGVKGTGSLAARSFLNFGEKTNDPKRGDIVVLERGGQGGSGHVGFFEGFDAKGNVRVLGGNQGNRVGTSTFSKDDVLGFRRAPDAAAQQKALEQQVELRDRILAQSEQQLSVAAETARYMGMQVQGMDREAEIAEAVAKIRRDAADELAKLDEAERRVTDGLDDQLAKYQSQADVLGQMLIAHGDREQLTAAQKAEEAAVLKAMETQLTAALALAKTAEDRLRIEMAIKRVTMQTEGSLDDGQKQADAKRRADEKAQQEWERFHEEQTRRQEEQIEDLAYTYERAFRSGGKSIWKDFKEDGIRMISLIAARWTMALASGQQTSLGSILGQIGATTQANGGGFNLGSIFNLFGGGGARSSASAAPFSQSWIDSGGYDGIVTGGSSIPGIFSGGMSNASGGVSGMMGSLSSGMPQFALAMAASSGLHKLFGIEQRAGGLTGPIGSFILNKLFPKKPKYGTAAVTSLDGELTGRGRGKGYEDAAIGAGGDVQSGLQRIIEALGGEAGSFNVSIGQYKDKGWRVSTTGYSEGPLNHKGKSATGLHDFGDDYEGAVRFAILDAIQDGAVTGISEAAKRVLKSGKDLDKALDKALLIESIPKRLRAMVDPVGAAIDELNAKWKETVAALNEGQASTEQMADAQKLYQLELEQVRNSTQSASQDLKDFLDSLAYGSSSPYSLRDQEAKAGAALQPFLDKIAAGQSIDNGKYTEAAQQYLDIERQLYGSGAKFFEAMDRIQAATGQAISRIDNAVPVRTISDPFNEATARNTATANELIAQQTEVLADVRGLLVELNERRKASTDFTSIGRGFTEAA